VKEYHEDAKARTGLKVALAYAAFAVAFVLDRIYRMKE
jgi:hypothetical protein